MAVARREDAVVVRRLYAARSKLARNLRQTEKRVHATQTPHLKTSRRELLLQLTRLEAVELELMVVRGCRKTLRVGANEEPPSGLEDTVHLAQGGEIPATERDVLQDVERDHDVRGR